MSITTQKSSKLKSKSKSRFSKINAWLHLWLGLASGIIVVIVSLTGCIYVFETEIKDFIEDWRFVKPQKEAFLLPSQLVSIADKKMKDKKATSDIKIANTINKILFLFNINEFLDKRRLLKIPQYLHLILFLDLSLRY